MGRPTIGEAERILVFLRAIAANDHYRDIVEHHHHHAVETFGVCFREVLNAGVQGVPGARETRGCRRQHVSARKRRTILAMVRSEWLNGSHIHAHVRGEHAPAVANNAGLQEFAAELITETGIRHEGEVESLEAEKEAAWGSKKMAVGLGLGLHSVEFANKNYVITHIEPRDQIQEAQHRLAIHLSKLYDRLKDYEPEIEYSHRLDQISRSLDLTARQIVQDNAPPPRQSTWRSLLSSKSRRDTLSLTRRLTSHEAALNLTSPKGLMLHGEVGTGKSMLVDLFADCLPNSKKKRTHFNTFMLETFAKLESLRVTRIKGSGRDVFATDDHSLLWLAKDMIQNSPILFLDEFQMPDRVASKILTNLMTGFFQLGGVLIASSNRMPEELAKAAGVGFAPAPQRTFGWSLGIRKKAPGVGMYGGHNEFAAFLEVLKARCEIWEVEGGKDWRRIGSGSVAPVKDIDFSEAVVEGVDDISGTQMQVPDTELGITIPDHYKIMEIGTTTEKEVEDAIASSLGQRKVSWKPTTMKVYGRPVEIPRAYQGVTKWTFAELCKAAHGPADYISLASTYHTLILTEVPVLTWLMKNEARRLITLLDALYECRCKLFVSAAAGPDDIFFPEEQKRNDGDEESDSVYSETLSEVYQDATAPFRPNILTENPNYAEPRAEPDYTHARLSGLLRADSLEDGSPTGNISRGAKGGSASNPFGRSFGKTDAEMQRAPVDPDEVRYTSRPNFQNTSAFTGEDERFAYKRAQSRLWEMCSSRWWMREEDGWHRPTPKEIRRWESDALSSSLASAQLESRGTDVRMGDAVSDETRPDESFKRYDGGPFKPKLEEPRKIGWMHFWGTIKWPGTRAGAWGKGPEGLNSRGKGK